MRERAAAAPVLEHYSPDPVQIPHSPLISFLSPASIEQLLKLSVARSVLRENACLTEAGVPHASK